MKLISENEDFYTYHDDVFGEVRVQKWESFKRQHQLNTPYDLVDGVENDEVNEEELQKGYEELYKEYIGAP